MKFDSDLEEGEIKRSPINYELEAGEIRKPVQKKKIKLEKGEIAIKNNLEKGEIKKKTKLEKGEIYQKKKIRKEEKIQKLEAGEISKDKIKYFKKKRCNICRKNKTNYTCPGCLINYCNLNCYKVHKEKYKCSGKINFGKKIRKGQMSEKSLKNDVFHINNLLRKSNKIKKKINILDKGFLKNKELMRYKLLKIHSKKKNIDLEIIPNIFENHRRNISFYYMGSKTIFWNLEIVLVKKKNLTNLNENDNLNQNSEIDNSNKTFEIDNFKIYKYFTDPIEDNKNLIDSIDLIDSKNLKIVEFLNGYLTQENIKNKILEKKLNFFFNNGEKFLELNPLEKIENILVNKKIIEFPILYIFDCKINPVFLTPNKFTKLKDITKIN